MSSDNYLQPHACPKLAVLLTEYPIATSIASHLTTKDLLNLSRTSKRVHQHLAEDMRNFRVIAQYTLCDGKAVLDWKQARGHYIKHPENLQCQGGEGKLCSSCGVKVCNVSTKPFPFQSSIQCSPPVVTQRQRNAGSTSSTAPTTVHRTLRALPAQPMPTTVMMTATKCQPNRLWSSTSTMPMARPSAAMSGA